jgi:CPA1 family monovalent cation:H+ antiporter
VEIAFLLVAVAVTVLAVTAITGRMGFAAPIPLILVGWAGSYVPGVPTIHLEPEVVLLGLLPPLLYAASISTSLVDFNANRRPILLLSVGLVAFTTVGVALVVHAILPQVGWAACFAIGAVVAPPDAVAATAIGRRIGLPRRIVTILEGESLLNDATALVALRTAVAAIGTAGAMAPAWHIGLDFVRAAGGGLVVGFAVFFLVAKIRRHVTDALLDTGISLVIPYAAYIAAEKIEASGVVAVVVAGLLLGHKAPVLQTAQSRIAERMNWRTLAFMLENTVFLLIGLQARWLVDDVRDSDLPAGTIVGACLATLGAVIVLRMVWVVAARYLLIRPAPDPLTGHRPPASYTFLLGWAGMRGVVTLAAAFVIPEDVPHREVLLMIAFTVVAGTLLLQGLSLGALARRLRVPAPDPMDDALARATLLQQASKAGFKVLSDLREDDPYGVADLIKQRIEQRNFAAWERLGTTEGEESPAALYSRVRQEMIEAERARVLEIRSTGAVPSEVVSDVLAMLDIEESMLDAAEEERADVEAVRMTRPAGAGCDHLEAAPLFDPEGEVAGCPECLKIGSRWVSLRMCLSCGTVGCCDSSPNRHATAHFHETAHPVIRSIEPGEEWRWCYVHHLTA